MFYSGPDWINDMIIIILCHKNKICLCSTSINSLWPNHIERQHEHMTLCEFQVENRTFSYLNPNFGVSDVTDFTHWEYICES